MALTDDKGYFAMVKIAIGPSTKEKVLPMANASVPFSRVSIDQSRSNVVAAAETLTIGYYLDGDTMIIASATTPGKLYVVTSGDCTCPAGLQELLCKHVEFRLNILYPRRTSQAETASEYIITLDLADELF